MSSRPSLFSYTLVLTSVSEVLSRFSYFSGFTDFAVLPKISVFSLCYFLVLLDFEDFWPKLGNILISTSEMESGSTFGGSGFASVDAFSDFFDAWKLLPSLILSESNLDLRLLPPTDFYIDGVFYFGPSECVLGLDSSFTMDCLLVSSLSSSSSSEKVEESDSVYEWI